MFLMRNVMYEIRLAQHICFVWSPHMRPALLRKPRRTGKGFPRTPRSCSSHLNLAMFFPRQLFSQEDSANNYFVLLNSQACSLQPLLS